MSIKLVLVDDDVNIHDAVQVVLRTANDIVLVGEGYDGQEALTICRRSLPDVLLMDVRMPGMGGVEATRQIQANFPQVKVVGLSSHQDYADIKDLLDAGAVGYLVKYAITDDLLDTIRTVAQGNSVLSVDVTRKLLTPPDTSSLPSHQFALTEREVEVLQQLAAGKNNKEAAYLLNVSERTVRFHLNNILEKMNVQTRSEALVLAAKSALV